MNIITYNKLDFSLNVKDHIRLGLINAVNKKFKFIGWLRAIWEAGRILYHANKYPMPTKDNTQWHNTHLLIDAFDKFLEYNNNDSRRVMMNTIFKVLICEYDHNDYYAFMLEFLIRELVKNGYEPEDRAFPMYRYWNGPLPKYSKRLREPDWLQKRMEEKLGVQ